MEDYYTSQTFGNHFLALFNCCPIPISGEGSRDGRNFFLLLLQILYSFFCHFPGRDEDHPIHTAKQKD